MKSRLYCVDAQADLGHRCPHMPEDTFSHDAAHLISCLSRALSGPLGEMIGI